MEKREFIKKCFAAGSGLVLCPRLLKSIPGIELIDRNRRIAMFQEETTRGIICNICPNRCLLNEGELSICNNRIVQGSRLYTLAYGNPCTINIDPVEKHPLFHFHPSSTALSIGTAGCNFTCLNCNTWTISQTSPDKTGNYDLMPDQVIDMAIQRNCRSIAYTYTEPVTFYEYVFETASLAREAGVKNILVSNGYIMPEPLNKLSAVIEAANIDLKTFNEKTYNNLTGGKLKPVLDTLISLKEKGIWLEITNLVIPDWTDNQTEIREMCKWLYTNGFKDTPLHFSRFQPQYKLEELPPTPVQILNIAYEIAKEVGLYHVYIGNVPGTHATSTFCESCGELVIARAGYTVRINKIKDGKCEICNHHVNGVW